jgi:hypothetical protein
MATMKTYTIEVNGKPALVFRAPDLTEAEKFSASWPNTVEQWAGAGFFDDKKLTVRQATHTERAKWWKESCESAEHPDALRAEAEDEDDPEVKADLLSQAERCEQDAPDGLLVSLNDEEE